MTRNVISRRIHISAIWELIIPFGILLKKFHAEETAEIPMVEGRHVVVRYRCNGLTALKAFPRHPVHCVAQRKALFTTPVTTADDNVFDIEFSTSRARVQCEIDFVLIGFWGIYTRCWVVRFVSARSGYLVTHYSQIFSSSVCYVLVNKRHITDPIHPYAPVPWQHQPQISGYGG